MTAPIPFFRAGRVPNGDGPALPIGVMSGVLIFDSGEADNTFLYRCQDRYLVYNALAGIRSLLFVADACHRQRYLHLIQGLNARLDLVSAWTEVPLPHVAAPFMVPLDADTLSVGDTSFVTAQLDEPGVRESIDRGEIVFNQASPTGARLLLEIERLLSVHDIHWELDAERLRKQAALSLWCHDKANYVGLVAAAAGPVPPHVRTAICSVEDVRDLRSWADLTNLYQSRTGAAPAAALYVKSTFDSGGNVAKRIAPENACEALRALRRDVMVHVLWDPAYHADRLADLEADVSLAASLAGAAPDESARVRYLEAEAERRSGVRFLVQEAIEPPRSDGAWHCEGLGITCALAPGQADFYAGAGQIYGDADRQHYIGSLLTTRGLGVDERLVAETRALAAEFTRRGYEGPINFDARRNAAGDWIFVYDCNPRLSAIYPALAVRSLLGAAHPVDTVISLGYRGEFRPADLEGLLRRLSLNGLLYSAATGRGALPLPNIARDGGCDFVLVNMDQEQIDRLVRSPVIPKRGAARLSLF